jgi:hypothetical protein
MSTATHAWLAARAALLPRAIPGAARPETAAAEALEALSGGSLLGVLFFGSQRTRAGADRFSAYDFFVVVDAYRPFYRALHAASRARRSPVLLAPLNAVLTPSQISLRLPDGRGGEIHAKCSVITLRHLRRETSRRRRDHFTIGRLFQPVEILWAGDEAMREALVDVLACACASTYRWSRPRLEARFDTDGYLRRLLEVSMGQEIRPEPTGRRVSALHEAQRDEQLPVYHALLEGLREDGELLVAGPGPVYSLARPVGLGERLRLAAYFRLSLVRATLRWFKYVVTFDDWLEYILRKVRRHTGQAIELTEKERRRPLIFLWPRLIRYLRHKNDAAPRNP